MCRRFATRVVLLALLTAGCARAPQRPAREAPSRATDGAEPSPIGLDPRITHPIRISGPDPSFTKEALRRRVEGTIVLRCRIGVDGRVSGCQVLKSLPYMDEAVVSALENRRYRPATLEGKPVAIDYTFRITLRQDD